jgi:shikimate dehydrogenase
MNQSTGSQDLTFLSNSIQLTHGKHYSMILGKNPSASARSPKLWNNVYSLLGENRVMHPFDVDLERLPELWEYISHDQRCIGGSVAVPYKEEIFRLLNGNTDHVTAQIGAVNCLYRLQDGRLFGTNTDGLGALNTIENSLDNIQSSSFFVFGLGGVGKSVAATISNVQGSKNGLLCSARNPSTSKFCETIDATYTPFDEIDTHLGSIDMFINCSSLGFGADQGRSPLSSSQLSLLKSNCVIFDVVYNPQKTKLLLDAEQLGFQVINGESMNLEQAVEAFMVVNNIEIPRNKLRELMLSAVK